MSHRLQIMFTDGQYARLLDESRRTGAGLAELVRRAVERSYGSTAADDVLRALEEGFDGWQGRDFDGASYAEGLRRGMARK